MDSTLARTTKSLLALTVHFNGPQKKVEPATITDKFSYQSSDNISIRTVQELLGHKVIAMTVRCAHLAPKHMLAAVERLDAPTEDSTDTTTDTRFFLQSVSEEAVLH
jgi:site-specific recombinase XerC